MSTSTPLSFSHLVSVLDAKDAATIVATQEMVDRHRLGEQFLQDFSTFSTKLGTQRSVTWDVDHKYPMDFIHQAARFLSGKGYQVAIDHVAHCIAVTIPNSFFDEDVGVDA